MMAEQMHAQMAWGAYEEDGVHYFPQKEEWLGSVYETPSSVHPHHWHHQQLPRQSGHGIGSDPRVTMQDGMAYYWYDSEAVPPHMLDSDTSIVDVWAEDLDAAFERIREIVVDYPIVAMDTEFPGIVARPVGQFKSTTDFYYQTLRCNVNLLKIIQLGVTFCNERGEHPPGPCTWQFNFRFNLNDDIYAQDSIELLSNSGVDFDRFAREGIEVERFAELLISSGLVLSTSHSVPVRWLSFHSGYDFGYLIKVLTAQDLPADETEFAQLLSTYFPDVFDVKYLLKKTGLQASWGLGTLGKELQVPRIGPAHQAGSDSLLTCHCFFKLASEHFTDPAALQQHNSILYGLGADNEEDERSNGGGAGSGGEGCQWDPSVAPGHMGNGFTPGQGNNNGTNSRNRETDGRGRYFYPRYLIPRQQQGEYPGPRNM